MVPAGSNRWRRQERSGRHGLRTVLRLIGGSLVILGLPKLGAMANSSRIRIWGGGRSGGGAARAGGNTQGCGGGAARGFSSRYSEGMERRGSSAGAACPAGTSAVAAANEQRGRVLVRCLAWAAVTGILGSKGIVVTSPQPKSEQQLPARSIAAVAVDEVELVEAATVVLQYALCIIGALTTTKRCMMKASPPGAAGSRLEGAADASRWRTAGTMVLQRSA